MAAAAAPLTMASGTSPSLYLSYGVASLKGRRPALSDAVATVESFSMVLSPPMGLDYFAVFDGHSGVAVAELLQGVLHAAIDREIQSELYDQNPRFHMSGDVAAWWTTTIGEAFRAVDEEYVLFGEPVGNDVDVGATALVALVHDNYLVLANCGFSKAVMSRGGQAVVLTPEHEGDEQEEANSRLLRAKETRRVFGSFLYKVEPMVLPDVIAVDRELGDEFLILASDGVWESVTPAQACSFVRQQLINRPWEQDARGSPSMLAKDLAEHAIGMGSEDNVTVVIVIFRDFWSQCTR